MINKYKFRIYIYIFNNVNVIDIMVVIDLINFKLEYNWVIM